LLSEGAATEVGVLLEYSPAPLSRPEPASHRPVPDSRSVERPPRLSAAVSRLDVIGAGNFARTMLLPHVKNGLPLGTVVNNTALSANHVKGKFGFAAAATDYAAILGAKSTGSGAVIVATRNHLHAPIVQAALASDRHVFVEKPLCLSRQELLAIDAALAPSSGSVQVGFNRRFAAASVELKRLVKETPGPKTVSYRVVPGKLEAGHWYSNYAESGGRVVGEACHFLDFFCFLLDASPLRVTAQTTWPATGRLPFPDSVTAQVEFADGSSAQLVYSAEGDPTWPKEVCTVFAAGMVAEIENFQKLVVHRGRKTTTQSYHGKGHAEQMAAWMSFLRGASEHPLPYEQSRQSMLLTFAVLESIQAGRTVDVG